MGGIRELVLGMGIRPILLIRIGCLGLGIISCRPFGIGIEQF